MRGPERRPDPEQDRRVPPPGEPRSGRRPYGLDDVDAALEGLQRFSHEPRFEEELGRGVDLLWEEADQLLDDAGRRTLELEAEEAGPAESWLLLDLALEDELRLVDHFLVEHGDRLANGERNYLLDLRETFVSLYEVQEVGDGTLSVLDLWNDVLVEVEAPERDGGWVRWDLCAGRLLRRPGGPIVFELGWYTYPAGVARLLLERLDLQYDWLQAYDPNLCERPFLKKLGFLFHHFWVESRTVPLRAGLAAGDHSVTLRYVLADAERAAIALDAMPGLQPLRRHLWIHAPTGAGAGGPVPRLEVLDDELRVEGLPGRAFEALRAGLEDLLGEGCSLAEERDEDRDDIDRRSASGGLRIPEAPAERYAEGLIAAVGQWLEAPSPWLRGRRPVECAGHEVLGGRVMDRLKELDNAQLRRAGRGLPHAELVWAWERLGIGGGEEQD